jgi:hypothetical protein
MRQIVRTHAGAGLLGAVFIAALIARLFVPGTLLDLFEHYSSTGGSMLEKLHPAAVIILAVFVMIYIGGANRQLSASDRKVSFASTVFIFAILAVVVLSLLTGHTQGESYLLDSLLVAPLAAIAMLHFGDRFGYLIFKILVYLVLLNALITIFEFVTHVRVIPYALIEPTFRPTGLMGHPLLDGMVNALMLPVVWLLPIPASRKMGLAIFLLVATFATQARISSLFSVIGFVASTWAFLVRSVREKRMDEGALVVSGIATIGLILFFIVLIVATGLADRLTQNGLNDVSAQSRFTVFRILGYLQPNEILFGVPREWGTYLVQKQMQLVAIEDPFVAFIVQFGAIGTAILAPSILYQLWTIARAGGGAYTMIAMAISVGISATSVSISGKGPAMLLIVAICMCARATNRLQTNRLQTQRPQAVPVSGRQRSAVRR